MNALALLRKEMMEQWRTNRLLVLLVVLGVFGMASPLLASLLPQLMQMVPGGDQLAGLIPTPTVQDAVAQYVKNISQFVLLLAVFLTMGTVVQEKERGTAVMILSKPVGRGAFLLAKFLALALSFMVSLVVAGGLGYVYTAYLFQAPAVNAWIGLNMLLWLYGMVAVAITLLAGTLVRSQAAAAGISFGAWIVLALLGSVGPLRDYVPDRLVLWGSQLFSDPAWQEWPALAVSLGMILISLLAAWLVFQKQEL